VLNPWDLMSNANVGLHLFYLRDFDGAINQLRRTIEMDSSFLPAHIFITLAYLANGDPEAASLELMAWTSLLGHDEISNTMEHASALPDRNGSFRAWLTAVTSKPTRFRASDVVWFAGFLGENEVAFEWLEKAFDERDPILP